MRCRFLGTLFKTTVCTGRKKLSGCVSEGRYKARDILVEAESAPGRARCEKYQACPDDLDDLISIGTIGLIKAVMTYDSKRKPAGRICRPLY